MQRYAFARSAIAIHAQHGAIAGPSRLPAVVVRCRCGQPLLMEARGIRQMSQTSALSQAEASISFNRNVAGTSVPPPAAVNPLPPLKESLGKSATPKVPRREIKAQKAAISLVSDYLLQPAPNVN